MLLTDDNVLVHQDVEDGVAGAEDTSASPSIPRSSFYGDVNIEHVLRLLAERVEKLEKDKVSTLWSASRSEGGRQDEYCLHRSKPVPSGSD